MGSGASTTVERGAVAVSLSPTVLGSSSCSTPDFGLWQHFDSSIEILDEYKMVHAGHDSINNVQCIVRARLGDGSVRVGRIGVHKGDQKTQGRAVISFNGQELQLIDNFDVLGWRPDFYFQPFYPYQGFPPGALIVGEMADHKTPIYVGTVALPSSAAPGTRIVIPGSIMREGILISLDGQQLFFDRGDIRILCCSPVTTPGQGHQATYTAADYWAQEKAAIAQPMMMMQQQQQQPLQQQPQMMIQHPQQQPQMMTQQPQFPSHHPMYGQPYGQHYGQHSSYTVAGAGVGGLAAGALAMNAMQQQPRPQQYLPGQQQQQQHYQQQRQQQQQQQHFPGQQQHPQMGMANVSGGGGDPGWISQTAGDMSAWGAQAGADMSAFGAHAGSAIGQTGADMSAWGADASRAWEGQQPFVQSNLNVVYGGMEVAGQQAQQEFSAMQPVFQEGMNSGWGLMQDMGQALGNEVSGVDWGGVASEAAQDFSSFAEDIADAF